MKVEYPHELARLISALPDYHIFEMAADTLERWIEIGEEGPTPEDLININDKRSADNAPSQLLRILAGRCLILIWDAISQLLAQTTYRLPVGMEVSITRDTHHPELVRLVSQDHALIGRLIEQPEGMTIDWGTGEAWYKMDSQEFFEMKAGDPLP